MRYIGTTARGIRLPIISKGDDLQSIVTDTFCETIKAEGIKLSSSDVLGVTEAIVAKAQGNFATVEQVAADVRQKFPGGTVGLVFPILSRNRFMNILKGICGGADKVYVLLQYPSDEVGNPIMDAGILDDIEDKLTAGPIPAKEFRQIAPGFVHPFTGIDYIELYQSASDNVEVYLSKDPRDILKLTKHVLTGEIHNRFNTKKRLVKAGAETVYTLSDILSEPVNGSGFNPDYGVLGSNLATDQTLKLFPRDSVPFVNGLRKKILERTGVEIEILVYGDGAFKDPLCGIWELADPVVSPGYTEKLGGRPDEIKIKYVAENVFGDLSGDEKRKAVENMIREKGAKGNNFNEGTTPRKYADLLGSLCDLMSGSGDKGTPVVYIKGYFDDYSTD